MGQLINTFLNYIEQSEARIKNSIKSGDYKYIQPKNIINAYCQQSDSLNNSEKKIVSAGGCEAHTETSAIELKNEADITY